ncbi:MAG: hypothetical protein HC908_08875, partial [Calothrix sp. SM1_7_51]|nr:hypothetical protein [Calothrix sp. SM1_7_51]
ITYKDVLTPKNRTNVNFTVSSNRAFSETDPDLNSSNYKFDFLDDVTVNFNDMLTLKADKAIFSANEIFLLPYEHQFCHLLSEDLCLSSTSLKFDLKSYDLFVQKPEGLIKNLLFFSADHLSVMESEKKSFKEKSFEAP